MSNFKQAYEYAMNNPTSDFAKSFGTAISTGKFDKEAAQAGYKDLSAIKNFYAPQPTPELTPTTTEKPSLSPGSQYPTPTLESAGKAIGSIFPGQKVGEAIGTLGGLGITAAKEKLGLAPKGSTEQYDTSAPSPLQVVGDVAKGAALVGGLKAPIPTTLGGAVGTGTAIGATSGAGIAASNTSGSAIPTSQDLGKVAKETVVGGIIGAGTSALAYGFGKLLEKAGEKILSGTIKPTQADIKDGFKISSIKKHDLGGSLSTMYDKTETKLGDLTKQLNDKLADSTQTIDLNKIAEDTINSLGKNKLKSFGSNTSLQSAVEQLQAEIGSIGGNVKIPDAQLVKQAAGRMGAWQYGVSDPASTARETVYNAFYTNIKKAIEDASPEGVKAINKQISELIPIANAIVRRIPVAERNAALSLPDMITLTASVLDPRALVGFGISMAQKSGAAGNILTKVAPKITEQAGRIGGLLGASGAGLGTQ